MNKWGVAAKGVHAIRRAVTVEQVDTAFNYFMLAFTRILKKSRKECRDFHKVMRMFADLEEVADEISNLENKKQQLLIQKGGNK